MFDYKRKPTRTHINTHTKALSVAWDCWKRWVSNEQPKMHIISANNIYLHNVGFSSTKHRNLVITIMRFWDHPAMHEKVCEAKIEFSQPTRGHVWFRFIYICHRWLSAITVCQLTVDSHISLVFSGDNNELSVVYFNYCTRIFIVIHNYLKLKINFTVRA